MATLDVFNQDPFTTMSLTSAVERNPFNPTGLGELNLFSDVPIRDKAAAVEERDGTLVVIPTSPRGAPPTERQGEKRRMRYFEVPRISMADTLQADEIQSVRAFGQESELMQVQAEVARRLSGPTGLTSSVEYTWERMRLGAVQGIVLDADGSTIYNWFTEFGISQPAEIDFDLDNASPAAGALRTACAGVVRTMARAAKGAFTTQTRVMAMCGDAFWDNLVSHPEVTQTYLNWAAAADLRQGTAFSTMRFGDIEWFNYRGSDDNTTIKVGTDKVAFFPAGAPGVFQRVLSPAETFDWVNTPGKPIYVIPIRDKDRNAWWRQEVYSYPLFLCSKPEVLLRGKRT